LDKPSSAANAGNARPITARTFQLEHSKDVTMAKILLVLYPDPVTGYPPVYARGSIPKLRRYPGGQSLPTPSAIDFTPGEFLGWLPLFIVGGILAGGAATLATSLPIAMIGFSVLVVAIAVISAVIFLGKTARGPQA
jgi:hypothetical protein